MPERLLHHDSRVLRQARLGEPADRHPEQGRRDLQIEDGCLGALDRLPYPLVGGVIGEVALDVGEPLRQAVEDLRVGLLAGAGRNRAMAVLAKVVVRPVVEGDADDRAVEQAPGLEPV